MPETCKNWLRLINCCVYYVHQNSEIYQELSFSVVFKASGKSTELDSI